jgi:hypothetical protein
MSGRKFEGREIMQGYTVKARAVVGALLAVLTLSLVLVLPAFCAASANPDPAITDGIGSIGLTLLAYLSAILAALLGVLALSIGIRALIKGAKIVLKAL